MKFRPTDCDHNGKTFSSLDVQRFHHIKFTKKSYNASPYDLYCSSVKSIKNLKKNECKKLTSFTTQARYLLHKKNNFQKKYFEDLLQLDNRKSVDQEKQKITSDVKFSIINYEKTFERSWVNDV